MIFSKYRGSSFAKNNKVDSKGYHKKNEKPWQTSGNHEHDFLKFNAESWNFVVDKCFNNKPKKEENYY